MLGQTRVISHFLVLLTLIGCDCRNVLEFRCSDSSVACPCGSPDAGIQVQVPIKKCIYFYQWKPSCNACDEFDQAALCSQFRNCLSCNARRDGKCATCPPGRYGDSCQGATVTCHIPVIANSALAPNQSTFQVGATAAISCTSGFELIGLATLTCLNSGSWNQVIPRCSRVNTTVAPVSCPALKAPDNGQIIRNGGQGSFLPGQILEFTCNEGFLASHKNRLICEADGNWSGSPARCIQVFTCSDPGTPLNTIRQIQQPLVGGNGEHSHFGPDEAASVVVTHIPGGRFRVLTRITYECKSRFYQLVGPQHRECQHGGQWSGRQPTCIPICGKFRKNRYRWIIRGEVNRLGEWPWQASLAHKQPNGTFYGVCGGTVISEDWIVTAAHCVTNRTTSNIMPINNLQVRLGMYHRNTETQDDAVQIFRVSEIHVHPNYDPNLLDSDIAVVRLATSATLTDRVAPVCMPGSDKDGVQLAERLIAPGSTIVMTGWGEAANGSEINTVEEASLGTISSQSCEDKYAAIGLLVTNNMFCGGYEGVRRDACFWQTGGPAVGLTGSDKFSETSFRIDLDLELLWVTYRCPSKGENRRWFLVGVFSWSSPVYCGIPNHYRGFTKMSRFLSFVDKFTQINETVYL